MDADHLRAQYLDAANTGSPLGKVFQLGRYHLRVWRGGIEWGSDLGGSVCPWRNLWFLPIWLIGDAWKRLSNRA